MAHIVVTIGAALAIMTASATAQAQQSSDPRVSDLVQSGTLRAGLFLTQFYKDATTGEPKSVWVETARALAQRIVVHAQIVEHPTPEGAVRCLPTGACDLVFLPLDARAVDVGDFSAPFIQFEYTLLVPAGSRIRSIADADRAGVRIAAVRNHASAVTLGRHLQNAEVVFGDTPDPTFGLLRTGSVDAMASARNTLLIYGPRLPGSRVLDDYYGANLNRIVVPKGEADRLAYINEFVEWAKASGFLRQAIDRAGPPRDHGRAAGRLQLTV
jgi:polar amino acid transport system substrate-binding protein